MFKLHVTLVSAALIASCGGSKSSPTTPQPTGGSGSAVTTGDKPVETPTDNADAAKVKAERQAAETAAYEKAKPVFVKYCSNCHTKDGKKSSAKKLGHFDMGVYPFGGEHTASIGNEIRKVLGIDGGKATMPFDKPGSVTGEDLATIKAWTEAWQAAGAAGVHPADAAEKDDD